MKKSCDFSLASDTEPQSSALGSGGQGSPSKSKFVPHSVTVPIDIRPGQIYLYGEHHSRDEYLQKELDLWATFYAMGVRDLFIEDSYAGAAFLNEWMQADDDEILLRLYDDLEGTMAHSQNVLGFYRCIKENFPETVFHGTDVDHQYYSTGERYLNALRDAGQENTDAYAIALENNKQGKRYYELLEKDENAGESYRENCMVHNFIAAYERSGGVCIMGIYGGFHVDQEGENLLDGTPRMAQQLAKQYGERLHTEFEALLI